jgi:hypothetical protein
MDNVETLKIRFKIRYIGQTVKMLKRFNVKLSMNNSIIVRHGYNWPSIKEPEYDG